MLGRASIVVLPRLFLLEGQERPRGDGGRKRLTSRA